MFAKLESNKSKMSIMENMKSQDSRYSFQGLNQKEIKYPASNKNAFNELKKTSQMLSNQSILISKSKMILKSAKKSGKKSGVQTAQNFSPAQSKSGSGVAFPELAIQQRRISAVNLIIRNRKSKDSLDDNSQDAMIKMVDLDSYIHQDPREAMLTQRKFNKDLSSIEIAKDPLRLKSIKSKKQQIVVNQTLSQVTSYIDTGERPEVLAQNISNKAEQYASSDVLMSKVSPVSAAEANPTSANLKYADVEQDDIEPVLDIEQYQEQNQEAQATTPEEEDSELKGDIVSANMLQTAEVAVDVQEHIAIQDGKEEARTQSNRLEHAKNMIYQPYPATNNGHMNLQENHTSSLLITPTPNSRDSSQQEDQGAADGLDCKGGSKEIKANKTPEIDVSQLKKIRQKKEALARQSEAIEIKGKKIDKNTMMNIINNRSNNLSRASVSPSNVNDSNFLNESPQGHNFIRTEQYLGFGELAFDIQNQKQKPRTQQKQREKANQKMSASTKGEQQHEASQASTLKRNSSIEANEKDKEKKYFEALPISEVQYKVSHKTTQAKPQSKNTGILKIKQTDDRHGHQTLIHRDQNHTHPHETSCSQDQISKEQSYPGCDLDPLAIILTSQQLTAQGISFSQLEDAEQTKIITKQHQILKHMQIVSQKYFSQESKMVSKQTGIMPDFTKKFGLLKEMQTDGVTQQSRDMATLENGQLEIEIPKIATQGIQPGDVDSVCEDEPDSRNQEQFVAKHTGVGTDDLAPLSDSGDENEQSFEQKPNEASETQRIITPSEIFNEGNSINNITNNTLPSHDNNSVEIKISPMYPNNLVLNDSNDQDFKQFLQGLSIEQKQYLYDKQLEKAYEYQYIQNQNILIEIQNTSSMLLTSSSKSKKQSVVVQPRVIVHNSVGKNHVLMMDPTNGLQYDIDKQKKEAQRGLSVHGDGVEIRTGTGPGTSMGILSKDKQQLLYEKGKSILEYHVGEAGISVKMAQPDHWELSPSTSQSPRSGSCQYKKNDSIIQKNKKQVILSSKSIERIQQQHQLLCDTVIKKRSMQNGQSQKPNINNRSNIIVNDQSRMSEIPGSHLSVPNSNVDITSQESYQRQLQLIKSTMSFWDHSQSYDQNDRINFLSDKLQRQMINLNINQNDSRSFQKMSQGNKPKPVTAACPRHHVGNDTVFLQNGTSMTSQQIRESMSMRNKQPSSSGSGWREHEVNIQLQLQLSKAQSQFEEQSPMFLPSRLKMQDRDRESMSNSRKQSQVNYERSSHHQPKSREASQHIIDVLDSSKHGELHVLRSNQNQKKNEKSQFSSSFEQNNFKEIKLSIKQGTGSLSNSVLDELPAVEVDGIIRDDRGGSGGMVEFDYGSFAQNVKGQYSRREELQGPRSDRARLPERIHQNNDDIAPHLGKRQGFKDALLSPSGSHETSGTQRIKREGQTSDFSASKRSSMLVNYKNHRLRVSIKGEGELQAQQQKQLEQHQQSPADKRQQQKQKLTNSNSLFHKACPKSISPSNGNIYYVNQDQLNQNLLDYTRKLAESMDKEARRRKLMEVTNGVNQNANRDPGTLRGERGSSAFSFAGTSGKRRRPFSPTTGIPREKRAFKINNVNNTQQDIRPSGQLQQPEDQSRSKGLFSRISSQFRDAVSQQYGDRSYKPQSTKQIVYTGIRSGDDTTKSRKGHIDNLLSNFSQYHKYEQINSHHKASNEDSKVSLANKEDGLPYFTLENSEQQSYDEEGQQELQLPACVVESSKKRERESAEEVAPALSLNDDAIHIQTKGVMENDSRSRERAEPAQRTYSGRPILHADSRAATASGDPQMGHLLANAAKEAVDQNAKAKMSCVTTAAQGDRQLEVEVDEYFSATAGFTHFQAPKVSMLGNQNQTYLNRTYDEFHEQAQIIKEKHIRSRGGLIHLNHMLGIKSPISTSSSKHVLHASKLLAEQRMLRLLRDTDLLVNQNNGQQPENIQELARQIEFAQSSQSFKGAMFNLSSKSFHPSGKVSRDQPRKLQTVFSQNQLPAPQHKIELLDPVDHSFVRPTEILMNKVQPNQYSRDLRQKTPTSQLDQSATSFFRHRLADHSQSKPITAMFSTTQNFGRPDLNPPSATLLRSQGRSTIAKKHGRLFNSKLNRAQQFHSSTRYGNIKRGRVVLDRDNVSTKNGIMINKAL